MVQERSLLRRVSERRAVGARDVDGVGDEHACRTSARAYESIHRRAIMWAVLRHGVPRRMALVYVREARRARMSMHDTDWETQPVRIGVGLRPACSAAPIFVRWVLQDCTEKLQGSGRQRGALQSRVLTHLALADDTWRMDSTQTGWTLLSGVARRGLGHQVGRCRYANCIRTPSPAPASSTLLQKIALRVLGTTFQVGKEHCGERDTVCRRCWSVFHMRPVLASTRTGDCQDTDAPLGHKPHPELVRREPVVEPAGTQRGPHDSAPDAQTCTELLARGRRDNADVHESKCIVVRESHVPRWDAVLIAPCRRWVGTLGTRQRPRASPSHLQATAWGSHLVFSTVCSMMQPMVAPSQKRLSFDYQQAWTQPANSDRQLCRSLTCQGAAQTLLPFRWRHTRAPSSKIRRCRGGQACRCWWRRRRGRRFRGAKFVKRSH